ncbi:MAG: serine/threonine-protein kinase PknK [Bradymonadaceae bacterium]
MAKNQRKSKRSTKLFAGRYAYQKPLGRGAGGSVYLAEDLHHSRRPVALKVLTPEACNTVQGKMLRREFEILSKLDHPHLVRVYDYGSLPDGGVYLAEEYIDGFSMQDARALLEPSALIDLTIQLLQGLSYLHGMGTIHRDIKPANVMLLWLDDASARPMAKLVDFGLSSMDPKRDTLRGGTRSYMAPEIIRGEKGEEQSDLYSLGVTLYYVLCGVLPFGPRTKEDPPPTEEDFRPPEPHRLNTDVPLVLSRFTMALLRQIPDVTYADAGEALQALAADSGVFDELSAGRMANSLDVAAAPVLKGYFERGILERRVEEDDLVVEWITSAEERSTGRFFLITGDEGVGRSRLMTDVESSSKLEGHLVVSASCRPGMQPFELLHALLRQTLELASSHDLEALEKFATPTLIRRRLTEMGIVTAGESADVMKEQAWIRKAFEEAAAMLAPSRLVLFVDDLDMADDESSTFLLDWYDQESSSHRPFLVAAAERRRIDRRFRSVSSLQLLPIEGISGDDVEFFFRTQLKLSTVSDGWLEEVATYADGKPDAIEELCRALIDAGLLTRRSARAWGLDEDGLATFPIPSGMRESFRRRMTAVGAGGRECLELLALLDRPLRWDSIRELLVIGGSTPEKADQILQTLQWRHMIVTEIEANGRYVKFIHADLAAVVGDMLSPEWRRALHRRIGRQLQEAWHHGDGDATEAASHLHAGGLHEEAGPLFEVAGDGLLEDGKFHDASEAYERALQGVKPGPARAFLHLKLARVALSGFDTETCRKHLNEAGDIAERTALDWLMYQVFVSGSSIALSLGDLDWAREWMDRLKDFLPMMSQQVEVRVLEARMLIADGKLKEAKPILERCIDRADYFGSRYALSEARRHLATLTILTDDETVGLNLYAETFESAEDVEDETAQGMVLANWGTDLRRLGHTTRAMMKLGQALESLANSGQAELFTQALLEIARCHADLGEFPDARQRAIEATCFTRMLGNPLLEEKVALFLSEILVTGRGA